MAEAANYCCRASLGWMSPCSGAVAASSVLAPPRLSLAVVCSWPDACGWSPSYLASMFRGFWAVVAVGYEAAMVYHPVGQPGEPLWFSLALSTVDWFFTGGVSARSVLHSCMIDCGCGR